MSDWLAEPQWQTGILEAAMNLTRLGELLDLADNAALTPSQARELADEQAQLQAATAWTAEATGVVRVAPCHWHGDHTHSGQRPPDRNTDDMRRS